MKLHIILPVFLVVVVLGNTTVAKEHSGDLGKFSQPQLARLGREAKLSVDCRAYVLSSRVKPREEAKKAVQGGYHRPQRLNGLQFSLKIEFPLGFFSREVKLGSGYRLLGLVSRL